MGKDFPIFLAGAVVSGVLLSHSPMETSFALTERTADHEAMIVAREIARSAIATGKGALMRDFGDAQAMRYLNVPAHGGTFDLVATLLPNGIVALSSVGRFGHAAYSIRAAFTRRYEGGLPGAVVADGPVDRIRFGGNRFLISGNDTAPPSAGGPYPGENAAIPALWLTSETAYRDAQRALQDIQRDNVSGLGGDGDLSFGPSPLDLDALHADATAAATQRLEGGFFTGTARFGTPKAPAIVHVTGDTRIAGTVRGFGLLVVEGDLEVAAGTMTWEGIVLVQKRGDGDMDVRLTGNAAIYGSLLIRALPDDAGRTPALNLRYGGAATVSYSAAAIEQAGALLPGLAALSKPTVVALERWESAGEAAITR